MNKRLYAFLLGLCMVSSLLFAGTAGAAQQELNFGIINTESSQNIRHLWKPFLEDMTKATGLKVNAFFASDYAAVVTAMQYNKIQLAWYGGKSAMEAVDRADGEVFLQTVHASGAGGYFSHLIAHRDSPLNNEKDMLARAKDLTFGNGDPNSTSGFLVPGYYVFGLNNVEPKAIFKRTLNANHETNALSVANKQVDVATVSSEVLERLVTTQPEKRAQIKIIWTSPLIPSDPLVWRKDMPADVKEKVRNFLVNYGKTGPDAARERAVLNDLQWSEFRPSGNDQLLPIRQLELFREKTGIQNNPNISAADKQTRLKAIEDQLTTLNARMDALNRDKKY